MPRDEARFDELAGVRVHDDRNPPPNGYGSKGLPRTFFCTDKLKDTLDGCFAELFTIWGQGTPSIILTAGTLGDGENAHGKGLAFDLDGFYWGEDRFMMLDYPQDRVFYNGINAHLFLFFSQVLSFHYPEHADHFHIDFNASFRFRTSSNAQTFFLQSCLVYLYGKDIGATGPEKDGVDGIYGGATRRALLQVLDDLGLSGRGGLTKADVWRDFLIITRDRAFAAPAEEEELDDGPQA